MYFSVAFSCFVFWPKVKDIKIYTDTPSHRWKDTDFGHCWRNPQEKLGWAQPEPELFCGFCWQDTHTHGYQKPHKHPDTHTCRHKDTGRATGMNYAYATLSSRFFDFFPPRSCCRRMSRCLLLVSTFFFVRFVFFSVLIFFPMQPLYLCVFLLSLYIHSIIIYLYLCLWLSISINVSISTFQPAKNPSF